MAESNGIVTLTMNPCLDISVEVEELVPARKLRCRNVRRDPGGGGINVSRVVSILGGASKAVFPAGGGIGRSLDEMLKEHEIDSQPIFTARISRENFAVRARDSGAQYRFVLPGPELEREEWTDCLEAIAAMEPAPGYVVASGSLPPGVPADFYVRLAEHCAERSTKLVVDTSGEPLKKTLQHGVYLAKPNQRELEEICGYSLADEKKQETVSREAVEQGWCEVLVLTLGDKGALLTTREEQHRLAALTVEQRSSIGAGDSFVGAMVLRLQQDDDLLSAFLYGMAAGSAAMVTEGTELCRQEDTEKFFQQLRQDNAGAD